MIKLDVRKYCDRCLNFEPEVTMRPSTEILKVFDLINIEKDMVTTTGDTVIKCRNRDRCEAIYEYIDSLKHT